MGDLQQEISELLGEYDGSESQESEHESEGTEETTESTESGEAGGEAQDEGSEAETSEAGSEEKQSEKDSEETDESEEKEVETKDEEIQRLRAEVDRVSQQKQTDQTQDESQDSEQSGESEEDFDPLMGYDFDSLVESKETFAEWASKLYKQARSKAKEDVYKELPQVVENYSKETVTAHMQAKEFYQNNPELQNYKNYVARVANEIKSEKPEIDQSQLLEETAKKAKEKLGIDNSTQKESEKSDESEQTKSPGLAKGTKRSPGSNKGKSAKEADQRTETEKQIDELLE